MVTPTCENDTMRQFLLLPAFALLSLSVTIGGCRAAECQQMMQCCEQVEDVDGLGGACAGLADDTRDPQTCNDVIRTIGYMLEDRGEPLPDACRR